MSCSESAPSVGPIPGLSSAPPEDDRTGCAPATLARAILDQLRYGQGQTPATASAHAYYLAVAAAVRDRLMQPWLQSYRVHQAPAGRQLAYLSAEFLPGPHLGRNLLNLGLTDPLSQALQTLGLDLDVVLALEPEPGLGSGSRGRVAACYLESLATQELPAMGYGIRYEFGQFQQVLRDGWQEERTDKWLQSGNPWELPQPEAAVTVGLGGRTEAYTDESGHYRVRWLPEQVVRGVPYDTPIPGYQVSTVNTLRLWRAEAPDTFNLHAFNEGDYAGAVAATVATEALTKVLYPSDERIQAKQRRLEQQYFLVACTLQDLLRRHLASGAALDQFHQRFAVQLNHTYPALAVAELMRLLVDVHGLSWERAWDVTCRSFAYAHPTPLAIDSDTWPLPLLEQRLPRHLEIIFELNQRFLDRVCPPAPAGAEEGGQRAQLSLIDETDERYLRLAPLACLGSYAVVGETALPAASTSPWADKRHHVIPGVSPRRWLALANPPLAALITDALGPGWLTHLDQLQQLAPLAEDVAFQQEWHQVKRQRKQHLAAWVQQRCDIALDPDSLFAVQVKRIHENQRQHLAILHLIARYEQLKHSPNLDMPPRTVLFAGKAAPGYTLAKLMIKLITAVAEAINQDPVTVGRLQVAFLPDYGVGLGQRIYPAADVGEHLAPAGRTVSGTGAMKLALNGARPLSSRGGVIGELCDRIGAQQCFSFGPGPESGADFSVGYNPWDYYSSQPALKGAIDLINSGFFAHGDRDLFRPLVDALVYSDPYRVLADYADYAAAQARVDVACQQADQWQKSSIAMVARMGYFSADRAVGDYARDIWNLSPVAVDLPAYDPHQAMLQVPPSR